MQVISLTAQSERKLTLLVTFDQIGLWEPKRYTS